MNLNLKNAKGGTKSWQMPCHDGRDKWPDGRDVTKSRHNVTSLLLSGHLEFAFNDF